MSEPGVFVTTTDWNGVKGKYRIEEVVRQKGNDRGKVIFRNSTGDLETMLVSNSVLKKVLI